MKNETRPALTPGHTSTATTGNKVSRTCESVQPIFAVAGMALFKYLTISGGSCLSAMFPVPF